MNGKEKSSHDNSLKIIPCPICSADIEVDQSRLNRKKSIYRGNHESGFNYELVPAVKTALSICSGMMCGIGFPYFLSFRIRDRLSKHVSKSKVPLIHYPLLGGLFVASLVGGSILIPAYVQNSIRMYMTGSNAGVHLVYKIFPEEEGSD